MSIIIKFSFHTFNHSMSKAIEMLDSSIYIVLCNPQYTPDSRSLKAVRPGLRHYSVIYFSKRASRLSRFSSLSIRNESHLCLRFSQAISISAIENLT